MDGILQGQLLDTFDRYYAPDVVMSENGGEERVGFEACRAYEEGFVNGVEFHAASVGRKIVSGDVAAIEWTFEFTPLGGERVVQKQVAVQTWRDGKVVREDFYYGG
ncbi:MAG: nuclear transport factor 2 family protein [Planctomycetota bacterium]